MPNTNDRKIIERLTTDPALEMNCYELEALLDNELRKPAEEIDAQLVEELVCVLQTEDIPADVRQRIWKNMNKQLKPQTGIARRLLQRFAAIAALIVLLFGVTIGAAQAFRWTFLLKLLQPVAETFGIYMNYSDDNANEAVPEHSYGISEDESTTVVYHDLSKIPDTYDGYAIKPGWIPEGYAFVRASAFTETNLIKYVIDYQRGTDELNIIVSVYPDPDEVISYWYDRTAEEVVEKKIDSILVTFYRNAKDSIQSVSWVDGNLHFYVSGNVSIDEIEKIVGSFIDQTE